MYVWLDTLAAITLKPNIHQIHTADADATRLSSRVGVGGVNTIFATISRRLPTDSVDNLET